MLVQVSLTIELAASVSLSELEQQIQEAGQAAMREAMKQSIRQWKDQHTTCPHCGGKQRRLEGTVRLSARSAEDRSCEDEHQQNQPYEPNGSRSSSAFPEIAQGVEFL